MSHRAQITLEDEQYARLQRESAETGLGLAELVRRAIDEVYRTTSKQEFARGLDLSFGTWSDSVIDGATYVERIRRSRPDRFAGR